MENIGMYLVDPKTLDATSETKSSGRLRSFGYAHYSFST